MTDEAGEHAFTRSPAFAGLSVLWAIVFAVLGASNISSGLVPVICLSAAVLMLVNAWWCWRTPYVRIDAGGLTAYPSIVSRPRTVAWTAVEHVEGPAGGRLYLLGPGDARMSVRMKTVSEDQRATLVAEVQRRSGRRLRWPATKPGKRR